MAIYKGDKFIGVNALKEKKVYVEVPEGSTIDDMSDQNTIAISSEQYGELQDAVAYRIGKPDVRSIPGIIDKLSEDFWIYRTPSLHLVEEPVEWTRPSDWPDLDSLNLQMSGDDFIYMTYDANQSGSALVQHIETADRQPATLDIGHIENGTYIVDETYSVNHNTNFIKWTDSYSGYLVIRITGQITRAHAVNVSRDGQTQQGRQMPLLERIAYVPHLTSFSGNGVWGSFHLQREKVANGDGAALTTLYCAWYYCWNLRNLDITGLRTQNVTNMDSTFSRCGFITSLDLRHFDVHKVTNLSSCFSTNNFLYHVNVTGWDTSNVTNMNYLFVGCRSLYDLQGVWEFNTSKVTSMISMFSGCWSLREIHVENYDVKNVTRTDGFFNDCHWLEELDLSKWRLEKVQRIDSMFANCQNLKHINFSGWVTGVLTYVSSLFSNCRSLVDVDISWLHVTNACVSIGSMFNCCYAIREINIPSDWDVTGISSDNYTAYNFFNSCYHLKKITGISNWNFQFRNSLSSMFNACYSLEEVDVSGWNVSTVTNLGSMFANCWSLRDVDVSNWYAPNATNVSSMFDYCYSLKSVDITNLKPGPVTTTASMFRWCSSLISIGNIDDWDTHACTSFASMFQDCESLEEIPDITKWDFSAATTVSSMFQGCMRIKEIHFDNINMPNCTNVQNMFAYCYSVKKAHVTGWSLPKVTSTAAGYFLGYCYSLTDVVIDVPLVVNHSFYPNDCLTHDSLLNILNNLPTVTTRRTLALMNANINRLSAEEKQIATNKNWTLSNS